jgi:hypothetical protein
MRLQYYRIDNDNGYMMQMGYLTPLNRLLPTARCSSRLVN